MPMDLKIFMEKLGVGYTLHPYETCPWSHYDPETQTTANAAVAVNSDGDEVECELLIIRDNPADDAPPIDFALWMKIVPYSGAQWKLSALKVHGEDYINKTYDVENNACDVFRHCVSAIGREEIPDIDKIMKKEFYKGSQGGQRGGSGGGKKSPNVKPEQMPGMGRKI